jgi:hypothetical protein
MKLTEQTDVPTYGLLYITRAYNLREITFEEWLELSAAWAEQVIAQHGGKHETRGNSATLPM